MENKKLACVIIGGGGFVGFWLAKNLIDKGHSVKILDPDFNYFHLESTKFNLVKEFRIKYLLKNVTTYKGRFQDIGHELVSKNNFQIIANLAAHAVEKPLDSKVSFNQISNDIELIYSIISTLKDSKANCKLVFMSSSAVYGNYDYATTEYAPLNPTSTYGISKAAGEFLIRANLKNWNIIRSNATYGYGDLGDRATHILVEKAFNKEKA